MHKNNNDIKKIGIDARMYSIPGGIGRYTRELIKGLERIDNKNKYVVFLDKEGYGSYAPENKNFQKILADIKWYGLVEQLKMPNIWKKEKLDLMHFTHFNKSVLYRRPYVVTIHDLTYSVVEKRGMRISKLPPIIYKIKFFAYQKIIKDVIKKAKRVIVPSQYSKRDIMKMYHLNSSKVAVTYESVAPDFTPEKREKIFIGLSERFGIEAGKYFVYVGNASPHKNLKKLVLAFNILSREDGNIRLVLAGKKEKFYRALEKWVEEKDIGDGRIVFTDRVGDDELKALLSNSCSFVFPSLAEGFGIPPLEAMASGTPVLTSKISCLPEICQDAALYFNPYDENDIADKMTRILEEKDLKNDLVNGGFEHIRKFSWDKMAKETLEVYEDALKNQK